MLHMNQTFTNQTLYQGLQYLTQCTSLKTLYTGHGVLIGRTCEMVAANNLTMSEMWKLWEFADQLTSHCEKEIKQKLIL